ncbi:MAG: branched-chain amino acid ABC transporter permease [Leptolyngbyaceae cyanobacterium]
MDLSGLINYGVFFLTLTGIYAILCLGLNIQWGYAGMLNIGVGAFFAVGAYTSTLVSVAPNDAYLGGFEAPVMVGVLLAMLLSGVLAFVIGLITLPLRSDYLAIATIGIAEIVRLLLKNEAWLTNGVRGIAGIPKPLTWLTSTIPALRTHGTWIMLLVVLIALGIVFGASDRAYRSPWGRVLRAVREDEPATIAAGKNVIGFRLQAFVLGSMVMGLAGALYAHFVGFISPEAFQPEFATFMVWVMLIAGGSGNTRGAIVGAFAIWGIWSGTELLTNRLPIAWIARASPLRLLLIGVLLQVILLMRPQGILPERPPQTAKAKRASKRIQD